MTKFAVAVEIAVRHIRSVAAVTLAIRNAIKNKRMRLTMIGTLSSVTASLRMRYQQILLLERSKSQESTFFSRAKVDSQNKHGVIPSMQYASRWLVE